jgi:hypothetical protein
VRSVESAKIARAASSAAYGSGTLEPIACGTIPGARRGHPRAPRID